LALSPTYFTANRKHMAHKRHLNEKDLDIQGVPDMDIARRLYYAPVSDWYPVKDIRNLRMFIREYYRIKGDNGYEIEINPPGSFRRGKDNGFVWIECKRVES